MLSIGHDILNPLSPWVDPDEEEDAELDAKEDQTGGYGDDKRLNCRALSSLRIPSIAINDGGEVEGHLAGGRA